MEKLTLDEFLKLPKDKLKGKIIVFPTDTVYGVGAIYKDEIGLEKIYQMKNRDHRKLLPVLCASEEQVFAITEYKEEIKKYTKYWPGALTIVLNKKDCEGTLAVRIPSSSVSLKVLEFTGPLSTTSVNYSGEKELNDPEEIATIFGDYIDYIIIDQVTLSKTPSTVIDCSQKEMKILRQGSIYL